LCVDDLGGACLFLLEHYDAPEPINVSVGEDITIRDLAETFGRIVGYEVGLDWDVSKPDGTPRKLLDVSKVTELGSTAKISLKDGIPTVRELFVARHETARL
jgi:GDP-L-fucose synthase